MFALVILSTVCCIFGLYFKENLKKRKYKNISKIFGGPLELPFIGVFYKARNPKEFLYDYSKLIRNVESKSVFVWYLSNPTFYTQNPDFMEKIFLSPDCCTKSVDYTLIDKEIGSGLLTLDGTKWFRHRKYIQPSFTRQALVSLFPIFNEKSSAYLNKLENLVGKGEVEMHYHIHGYSIKTAMATQMDFEIDDDDQRTREFINHVHRFMKIIAERILNFVWYLKPIYRLSNLNNQFKDSQKFIHDYLNNLVNDKIKSVKMENQQNTQEDNLADIMKRKRKFIYQVIDAYQKGMLSLKEVYEESRTFFFAGYETSGTNIYSTLTFLAMHPQYQDKLYEELKTFYPQQDFSIKCEDLKNLVYLDMVIRETLRVAATGPFLSRVATNDMDMGNGVILPKGTTIIMDIFNMHRNQDIWGPNAKQFNPDNFLPENMIGKHPFCYTPFAKGTRMCIGWKYAEYFMKITLAKIVRNYRFTTKFRYEDLRYVPNITLKYKVSPKLEIHRR